MNALDARKSIQRILGVTDDGAIGKMSRTAFDALASALPDSPWPLPVPIKFEPIVLTPTGMEPVDPRSEENIVTLHPALQPLARGLIRMSAASNIIAKVTSGTRTYEQQAELRRKYLQGGPKAAAAGYSNHNFALAFDITLFQDDHRTPIYESPQYATVGAIGKRLGLFWGGDWEGNDADEPHFELRPAWAGNMDEKRLIAELRRRTVAGEALLA